MIKLLISILLLIFSGINSFKSAPIHQRVIIIMMDGFGEAYYRNSSMPNLNIMEKNGIFKIVPSLMPSVTNVNNVAICTGELPEKNGIVGNSFYNTATGKEEFMEEDTLVLAPTIFQRAEKKGVKSLLFSSKKKSIALLHRGASETLSPETASKIWIERVGVPPSVYSREVNYWLFEAALYSLRHEPDAGIVYIHPTDYPMHTWAPESQESKEHLHRIDEYIGRLTKEFPDAAILITADHTVNHKSLCIDLQKACDKKKTPIKIAISCERDKYFKHHRGFGGSSYVYLNDQKDSSSVRKTLEGLSGVEDVLTRDQAAHKFHLMPQRIGDFMVLGDANTVFGDLDKELEFLPENYRSHGSLHEAMVPIFVYNAQNPPSSEHFTSNYKLAAWLYRE
jgi:phosphonoacetate hydrolase